MHVRASVQHASIGDQHLRHSAFNLILATRVGSPAVDGHDDFLGRRAALGKGADVVDQDLLETVPIGQIFLDSAAPEAHADVFARWGRAFAHQVHHVLRDLEEVAGLGDQRGARLVGVSLVRQIKQFELEEVCLEHYGFERVLRSALHGTERIFVREEPL